MVDVDGVHLRVVCLCVRFVRRVSRVSAALSAYLLQKLSQLRRTLSALGTHLAVSSSGIAKILAALGRNGCHNE